ncbi:hypothetical protein Dimus_003171 [Dionaea muscipula]
MLQALPPSASSSPSHDEFSFTISFHNNYSPTAAIQDDKKKAYLQPPQSIAIDLTPADDIFFHGHLLPLHLPSSNLPNSSPPRSSTNSLDSFTLPITEFLEEGKPDNNIVDIDSQSQSQSQSSSFNSKDKENSTIDNNINVSTNTSKLGRGKNKPFSLLGLKRWRSKGLLEETEKPKRKLKISDVSHFLSRMVRPLMFFKGNSISRELDRHDHDWCNSPSSRRQYSQSFSGNLLCSNREKSRDLRGRRGEFSAPASMRTSPTDSGLLLAKAGLSPPASDSTMEELQAAIQAAIAHYAKNQQGHYLSPLTMERRSRGASNSYVLHLSQLNALLAAQ